MTIFESEGMNSGGHNKEVGLLRLRGGGGDGGATGAESRDSYLSMYATKKPQKVDPKEEKLASFTQCRLTHDPLSESPESVVMDPLGRMFNKESAVAALLENRLHKTPLPPALNHVTSLKEDLTTLKLSLTSSNSGGATDTANKVDSKDARNFQLFNNAPFCCPITGRMMNGMFRFVALRPSGWVFSEQAMKEARPAVEDMIGHKLSVEETVVLNGTPEEMEELAIKNEARRLAAFKAKKEKKEKNGSKRKTDVIAKEVNGEPLAKKNKKESQKPKVVSGSIDIATEIAKANAKKYKASDHMPEGATPSIYASLFTSSSVGDRKETYGARNLSLHR